MKKILMAVVLAGMAGGAYAADFSDLQTSKASNITTSVFPNPVTVTSPVNEKADIQVSYSGAKSGWNPFEELDEEYCPKPTIISQEVSAVCKVKDSFVIYQAKVERKNQIKVLPVSGNTIVELGIWPDDCTDGLFSYYYELFSAEGKKIGYADLSGYENSEMAARIQLLTRYTLKGDLAAVTVISW